MSIALVILSVVMGVSGTVLFLGGPGTPNSGDSQWDCTSDPGYHCLVYTYDSSPSRPFPGVSFDAIVSSMNSSTGPYFNSSSTTGADGLAWLSWNLPPGNYSVQFTFHWPFGDRAVAGGLPGTDHQFALAHRGLYPQTTDLQVLLSGPGRSAPNGVSAGYLILPNGTYWSGSQAIPFSLFTHLGSIDTYVSTFPLDAVATAAGNRSVVFGLFDSTGGIIAEGGLSGTDLAPPPGPDTPGASLLFVLFAQTGLFVPLLGVLSAYSVYGRARVSGTLEAVLARPVSRHWFIVLRYGTAVAGATIAIFALLVALQVSVLVSTGYVFPFWVAAVLFGAFFVEWMALAGLTLLLSHLLRSSGGLIGAGIGLFMTFVLVWPLTVLVLTPREVFRGPGFSSSDYFIWIARAYLPNPAEFQNAVASLVFGSSPAFSRLDLATAGITPGLVVGIGVAFVLLPALGFYALARWRD